MAIQSRTGRYTFIGLCLLLSIMGASLRALAQETENQDASKLPPAQIVNDEGGAVAITGEVTYSNAFFTIGVAAPMIILEDQSGFVDRNESYIFPVESQTLGQITSDFYVSPFSYSLALPIEPQGARRDVDNDGETDSGVMIFAVAYWTNTFGDPFLEERDLFGGGWSTAYASTHVSREIASRREVIGGSILVYAADDQQGFPISFGEDGKLFTADDSRDDSSVRLPQGYTIVNLDTEPFTFDRSRNPVIDLLEPTSAATEDFSDLAYAEAFDAMIEKMRKEYAFTEYKEIDWDQRVAEFRPRFVQAEEDLDRQAYLRALADFSYSIPDGHVSGPFLAADFRQATSGGIGMAIRELDDGRVLVNFLLEGGPAAESGIELGAEILSIDGRSIDEALVETVAWAAPFSTDHFERLQKLRYVVRSPVDATRTVSFRNGEETPATVTLAATDERESFTFSSFARGLTGFELPVEYQLLENGYAYAKIYDFSDNELLTIQLWERLIRALNDNEVPGLLIDMRQNGGGSGFLADQMAAYFYNQEHELGNAGFYNEELNEFYFDERGIDRYYLPPEDLRYDGEIAVLIGPNCNSACEFFSYDLTIGDRAAIVGQYPTAGLGGSIDVFIMPEDEYFQFTAGRAVDMNGEIHIEGKGVEPTIRVPVDEETLFSVGDPVLDAAVAYLNGEPQLNIFDGGRIALGDSVSGTFVPSKRVRYRLTVDKGDVVSIFLEEESGGLDTILRLYNQEQELLFENDNAEAVETANSALERLKAPDTLTMLVEVATIDDALAGPFTLRIVDAAEVETAIALSKGPGAANAESVTNSASDEVAVRSASGAKIELPAEDQEADTQEAGAVPEILAPTATQVSPTPSSAEISDTETVTPTIAPTQVPTLPPTESAIPTDALTPTPEPTTVEPAAREPTEQHEIFGKATVNTQGARLRVRAEPNTGAAVVGHIGKDTTHDIVEFNENRTWLRILVSDLDIGESGWVSTIFMTVEE